jgi:hypothetical protein
MKWRENGEHYVMRLFACYGNETERCKLALLAKVRGLPLGNVKTGFRERGCETCDLYRTEYDSLLGHSAMQSRRSLPTFQRCDWLTFIVTGANLLTKLVADADVTVDRNINYLFAPENGESMFLRNFGIYLCVFPASRHTTSSSSSPWEPYIAPILS